MLRIEFNSWPRLAGTFALAFVLLLAGCQKTAVVPPKAAASESAGPKEPQAKLATMKLWVGPKEVIV